MSAQDGPAARRPRRPLFQKYFIVLFAAVVVPLLANGAGEAWFGYRDQKVMLSQRLRAAAGAAAGKLEGFLNDITDQLQWTVQLPWREGNDERGSLRMTSTAVSTGPMIRRWTVPDPTASGMAR
jgi:hypothetical protein